MTLEREFRNRLGDDARRVAETALAEDGSRDISSDVALPPDLTGTGGIEFRVDGILAGTGYADAVATAADLPPVTWFHASGSAIKRGTTVGLIRGPLARILRAERPLLNLLQRAVGIATMTRAYVDAVAGTPARILHTRKTAPGLRLLDVSAVLAGGGHMHRLNLSETMMIKDNHWQAISRTGRGLSEILTEAREEGALRCQVEVETAEQVEAACAAGADRLLVDNQTPATVGAWAAKARALSPTIEIEATGGITLANVRSYAAVGADYISIGGLTHSVVAADISLEVTQGD